MNKSILLAVFLGLLLTPIISANDENCDTTSGKSSSSSSSSHSSSSSSSSGAMTGDMEMEMGMETEMEMETEMDMGMDMTTTPASLLTTYAVDIHFIAGDESEQYLAYHYCAALAAGYLQCDVFNGTANNSRLVAVELIIDNATFAGLSDDEKILWHSHAFPILSGLFVLPEVPAAQELGVLQSIIDTYGKVIDIWQMDEKFPAGAPKLAYGLHDDSQVIASVAKKLDDDLKLSTTYKERAEQRKSLVAQPVIKGAGNNGKMSTYTQFVAKTFKNYN